MASVRKLESVLVSKRILFKKAATISKEQSPVIRDTVCNILIENVVDNYNILLRPADSFGLIIAKLKRKG